jgi:hypothetical protein
MPNSASGRARSANPARPSRSGVRPPVARLRYIGSDARNYAASTKARGRSRGHGRRPHPPGERLQTAFREQVSIDEGDRRTKRPSILRRDAGPHESLASRPLQLLICGLPAAACKHLRTDIVSRLFARGWRTRGVLFIRLRPALPYAYGWRAGEGNQDGYEREDGSHECPPGFARRISTVNAISGEGTIRRSGPDHRTVRPPGSPNRGRAHSTSECFQEARRERLLVAVKSEGRPCDAPPGLVSSSTHTLYARGAGGHHTLGRAAVRERRNRSRVERAGWPRRVLQDNRQPPQLRLARPSNAPRAHR